MELQEVNSTNALALALGRAGAPEGTVVLARRQRGGRGRWGRPWSSPEGGLYASVVLRPGGREDVRPIALTLVPLVVAIAAAEAVAARGLEARLRWPNDLFVEQRKLAGILCESTFTGSQIDCIVAGVGVNVNQLPEAFPVDVRERATSLRILLGEATDPDELLFDLAAALERRYRDHPRDVLERFQSLVDGSVGERIRYETKEGIQLEATTAGIAEDGGLRVTLDDGASRVLYAEEVHKLPGRGR